VPFTETGTLKEKKKKGPCPREKRRVTEGKKENPPPIEESPCREGVTTKEKRTLINREKVKKRKETNLNAPRKATQHVAEKRGERNSRTRGENDPRLSREGGQDKTGSH